MSSIVEVHLEWKYTPKNYIEEPIQINDEGYELSISDGSALAKINPIFHTNNPKIGEALTKLIENRFYAVQLMSHRKFSINKPTRSDLKKDGGKNHFLEIDSVSMTMTTGSVDIVIKDKDGNIVSDSKRDRLEKQRWFAEALSKYRGSDSTLDRMLKSYNAAVKDPQNEFVHLYEIRDALSVRFGKQKNAIKHLGITNEEWKVIGNLANSQPLKEGRHRGKSAVGIRPAEKSELEEARKAVSTLVEKYLKYLEAK